MGERVVWRQLLENAIASHSSFRHSRFCQLATVRPNGTPANRTVVFRGFVDGTDNLLFTTDSRSNKVQDAQHCSAAEVCYYFIQSWEQFRIHGQIEIIGDKEVDDKKKMIRERTWFSSSLKTRYQFTWPDPGEPKTPQSRISDIKLDASEGPLDTFCVVTLRPTEVDYLHLQEQRRIIFRSIDDREWAQEDVNP